MNSLASMCPCGHAAYYHPTPEQQAMQLKRTDGRYAGECKGGTSAHCRCITDRQQVIAAAATTEEPAMPPDLRAALARVLHIDVADLPEPAPYDEGQEARMSHVAETHDPETGRSQGLLPRKDRR